MKTGYEKDVQDSALYFVGNYLDIIEDWFNNEEEDFWYMTTKDGHCVSDLFREGCLDVPLTPMDRGMILEHNGDYDIDSNWEDWYGYLEENIKEKADGYIRRLRALWERDVDLDTAWEHIGDSEIDLVTPGSEKEKRMIETWFVYNDNAGWQAGMPVGSAYIDGRCGMGYSIPRSKLFVDYDSEFAKSLPHLEDMHKWELQEYYDNTFNKKSFIRRLITKLGR